MSIVEWEAYLADLIGAPVELTYWHEKDSWSVRCNTWPSGTYFRPHETAKRYLDQAPVQTSIRRDPPGAPRVEALWTALAFGGYIERP